MLSTMHNENILITGCGGMLGSAVYPIFSGTGAQILATDIEEDNQVREGIRRTARRGVKASGEVMVWRIIMS